MYLESYMSRVLDIPKYRANKDKDKDRINLVYFIRFIHYKLVSYDKQCLPHSSGEFKIYIYKKNIYIYIYIYRVAQKKVNLFDLF